MRRVGIIGLGDMGMGMARNIINGGFPLTGFDLREARLAELELAVGTRAATSRNCPGNRSGNQSPVGSGVELADSRLKRTSFFFERT